MTFNNDAGATTAIQNPQNSYQNTTAAWPMLSTQAHMMHLDFALKFLDEYSMSSLIALLATYGTKYDK